jgi:Cft2 family RNA processing exonuclease
MRKTLAGSLAASVFHLPLLEQGGAVTPFWTTIRYCHDAVHLTTIDLWLDSQRARDWGFISHAHSDHIAAHKEAILSSPTARFLRVRRAAPLDATILPFGEARMLHGLSTTLYPSGHILGSAQLLLEHQGERLLYSGDFKLTTGMAAEPIAIPTADVLIMETTFGHPRYAFPEPAGVVADMIRWCRECLAKGVTPVLLGYSLGKGQEVLAALAGQDFDILLHPALYEMTRIAEECGVRFPPFRCWERGQGAGCVVLAAPHLSGWIRQHLPPSKFGVVTGWVTDPQAIYRYNANIGFPLSDHADYADLLAYVERVHPRQIYTVHGYAAEFAGELRRRGYAATALSEEDQLELF